MNTRDIEYFANVYLPMFKQALADQGLVLETQDQTASAVKVAALTIDPTVKTADEAIDVLIKQSSFYGCCEDRVKIVSGSHKGKKGVIVKKDHQRSEVEELDADGTRVRRDKTTEKFTVKTTEGTMVECSGDCLKRVYDDDKEYPECDVCEGKEAGDKISRLVSRLINGDKGHNTVIEVFKKAQARKHKGMKTAFDKKAFMGQLARFIGKNKKLLGGGAAGAGILGGVGYLQSRSKANAAPKAKPTTGKLTDLNNALSQRRQLTAP